MATVETDDNRAVAAKAGAKTAGKFYKMIA
jgi:hypothetical protein